jgi:hypothetical protein
MRVLGQSWFQGPSEGELSRVETPPYLGIATMQKRFTQENFLT